MIKAFANFFNNHDEYAVEYLKLFSPKMEVYKTRFYLLNYSYLPSGKIKLSSITSSIDFDFSKAIKPCLDEINEKNSLTLDAFLGYIEIFSQEANSVVSKYNLRILPDYERKFGKQPNFIRKVTLSIEKDPDIISPNKSIYKGTLYENGKFKSAKIKLYPGKSELSFTFYSAPLTDEIYEGSIDDFTDIFFFKMNVYTHIKITEVL
ncbi:MAG: hypothetical protein QXX30_00275 [Candidatus Aenigmatarchaeota archaeon]